MPATERRSGSTAPLADLGTVDVAVIGAGVMGRAAAWQLAADGHRVAVFEQCAPDAAAASSRGATRGLRFSYEDPAYTRLAMHAETWWRVAERVSGRSLLRMTGGIDIGVPGTPSFDRTVRTVGDLGLDHELLSPAAVHERFPFLSLTRATRALVQPGAGLISADAAIAAFEELARAEGATFHFGCEATRIEVDGHGVEIALLGPDGAGAVRARHAVIAAGPWTGRLLGRSTAGSKGPSGARAGALRDLPLQVLECGPIHVAGPADPALEAGPLYYLHPDDEFGEGLYVQPQPGGAESRLKVGRHGGRPVDLPDVGQGDHSRPGRGESAEDATVLVERLASVLPSFAGATVVDRDRCWYTMTPDEGFVIDRLDPAGRLLIAAGFSGHGFKFAPVVGRILADLVDGEIDYEIEGMRAARFAGSEPGRPVNAG